MKNNGILVAVITVLCIAILGACFSEWDGGKGSIDINSGSGDAGLTEWMKDPATTYTVTLLRNSKEYSTSEPLSYDDFMAFELPPGTWDIVLWVEDATEWTNSMKWTGSNVIVGATNVAHMNNANPSSLDKFEREFERKKKGGEIKVGESLIVDKPLPLVGEGSGVTITLTKAIGKPLFQVTNDGVLTLKNITLEGAMENNRAPLVEVIAGGKLEMGDESIITGNTNIPTTTGEAVNGGGVRVTGSGAKFTMKTGAKIHGNHAIDGAGVKVNKGATFSMEGGDINNNHANSSSTLTNNGSNGTAGGVHVADGGRFYMSGGRIYGNEAILRGGGVYIGEGCYFNKTTGTICGDKDEADSNTVKVGGSTDKARDLASCAVYAGHSAVRYRQSAAGEGVPLFYDDTGAGSIPNLGTTGDNWSQ